MNNEDDRTKVCSPTLTLHPRTSSPPFLILDSSILLLFFVFLLPPASLTCRSLIFNACTAMLYVRRSVKSVTWIDAHTPSCLCTLSALLDLLWPPSWLQQKEQARVPIWSPTLNLCRSVKACLSLKHKLNPPLAVLAHRCLNFVF